MPVQRISDFDTWRAGYGGNTVRILLSGGNELIKVYADEALTIEAPNPQVLLSRTLDATSYGKFVVPLYTDKPYQLLIETIDRTGIQRPPLTSLSEQAGTGLVVAVEDGGPLLPLSEHLGRMIYVRDEGEFIQVGGSGASPATNTASIVAAIGKAAGRGGGIVRVPSGTYAVTSFPVPKNVVVMGEEREATTLQTIQTGRLFTVASAGGFARLTLDGVSQVAGSIAIYDVGADEIVLDDVVIKRFEQARISRGAQNEAGRRITVSDCVRGFLFDGNTDKDESKKGREAQQLSISGSLFELCSEYALCLRYTDADPSEIAIRDTSIFSNTGTGLKVIGAKRVTLDNVDMIGNTVAIDMSDQESLPAGTASAGFVQSFSMFNGVMSGGAMKLKGNLGNVIFQAVAFKDVDITLTTPGNNVIAVDCTEDSKVTLAGTPTSWTRSFTTASGGGSGITTGDAATRAWAIALKSGQRVYLEGKAIGRRRNGPEDAFYWKAVSAKRAPATLAYDSQTANFTKGNVVTGGTSGASGRIVDDVDSGTVGILSLQDVTGVFVDNEIITDGSSGSATVNGAITEGLVSLVGAVTAVRADQETVTGWDATFAANGPEVEFRVTGAAGQTVEWTVDVSVVSS